MNRKGRVNDIIECLEDMHEDRVMEMANIQPKESGLKYVIWLDPQGRGRKVPHNLTRVKVELKEDRKTQLIPVILYPDGARLLKGKTIRYQSEVEKWVESKRDIITRHYYGEISDYEALKEIIEDK